MAGIRDRFSRLFDDEDDEIKTVIKETDDSSPNTKTTTITRGRGPGRDSQAMSTDTDWTSGIQAPKVGNGNMATGDTDKVLGILDGLMSEVGGLGGGAGHPSAPSGPEQFGGYPNQMGIGTNGYEPRKFQENSFTNGLSELFGPYNPQGGATPRMDPGMGPGSAVGMPQEPPQQDPRDTRGRPPSLTEALFPGTDPAYQTQTMDPGAGDGGAVGLPQIDYTNGLDELFGPYNPQGGATPRMDPGMGPGGANQVSGQQNGRIIDRLGEVNGSNQMDPGMGPGGANGMPIDMMGPGTGPGSANGNPLPWNPMYPNPQENSGWTRSPGSPSTYGIDTNAPTGRDALAGVRDPNSPWPSESYEPAPVDVSGTPQTFTDMDSPMGPVETPVDVSGTPKTFTDMDSPFKPPATTVKGAEKDVVDSAENDQTSYTVEGQQPTIAQTDALTRTWGKLAYDPKKRRDEYMKRLNKIYANTMALEALAIISGKPSRAGMYSQMAMGKLDAMQKFDSEDRLQQLTNALYFDKNGEYAPPANKADAHAALMQMGASLNEATAIVGHVPAAVATDNKTYYKYDPKTNRVIARGAPSKMAPDGWGSNDWAQKEFTKNNPDANQDVLGGTDAEKGIKETQLINALAMVEPGSTEHANISTQLNSLRQQIYGDPADAFKDLFPAETREGYIPKSYKEILGKKGTYAQAMQHFMDPNNYDKLSYNYYRGWTPTQQGAVTASITNGTPEFSSADEIQKALENGTLKMVDGKATVKLNGQVKVITVN